MIRTVGAVVRATLIAMAAVVLSASLAGAQPCLIFVHGKQTDTNTFTSYASARNYWVNGSHDAVKTATKNFAAAGNVSIPPSSGSDRARRTSSM